MSTVHKRWILGSIACMVAMMLCGQPTWRRTYGALDDEQAQSVRRIDDNKFLLAGTSGSFGSGTSDIYLMLINELGVMEWSRNIGGPGVERLGEMRVGDEGAVWLAGYTNSSGAGGYDGQLIKVGPEGDVLLQRELGGADWDFFHDLRIMPDGGLLVAGETFSFAHPAGVAWLIRYNATGDTLWTQFLEVGPGSKALALALTSDGGAIVSGSVPSNAGDLNAFLCKTDGEGNVQWSMQYGGEGDDLGQDVLQCADGGYSFIGSTTSYSQWTEAYHVRTDEQGNMVWDWNWGQINDQEAREHELLDDGGFISIGYTKTSGGGGRDMFLMRSAPDGDFVFGRTYGGGSDDEGSSLVVLPDGFLSAGLSRSYGAGGSDVFVVRAGPDGTTETENVTSSFDALSIDQQDSSGTFLFPNPTTGLVRFEAIGTERLMRVHDVSGRMVREFTVRPGQQEVEINVPSGIYLLTIGSSGATRLIVERP